MNSTRSKYNKINTQNIQLPQQQLQKQQISHYRKKDIVATSRT